MNKKIGIGGCIAIVIGVFTPLFKRPPFVGAITYASQKRGEGVLLVIVAIIAGFLYLKSVNWPGFVLGLLVLGDVGLTGVNFAQRLSQVDASNPFAQALTSAISPGLGFALFNPRGLALLASPFFAARKAHSEPQIPEEVPTFFPRD